MFTLQFAVGSCHKIHIVTRSTVPLFDVFTEVQAQVRTCAPVEHTKAKQTETIICDEGKTICTECSLVTNFVSSNICRA